MIHRTVPCIEILQYQFKKGIKKQTGNKNKSLIFSIIKNIIVPIHHNIQMINLKHFVQRKKRRKTEGTKGAKEEGWTMGSV